MTGILAALAQSSARYPLSLDLARDAILFLGMDEADYRASAFLDERIASKDKSGEWTSVANVELALANERSVRPLHFIFHAGHVGSTLLSRLIDETDKVLPLREPMPLRTIAEAYDRGVPNLDLRLETLLRLWERGFDGNEAVVLKPTSATERLAPKLLTMRPEARAVMLNVSAESYLATMLAAPNSAIDLNAHGPERMHRLGKMKISVQRPTSLYELAAMSWLAETLTQEKMRHVVGSRAMAVDFDAMLQSLETTLDRVLAHFGIGCDAAAVAAIAQGPALARYSKAPEHEYSPTLRADLLNEARSRYPEEIRAGLRWLEKLAATHPAAAAIL